MSGVGDNVDIISYKLKVIKYSLCEVMIGVGDNVDIISYKL